MNSTDICVDPRFVASSLARCVIVPRETLTIPHWSHPRMGGKFGTFCAVDLIQRSQCSASASVQGTRMSRKRLREVN